MKSNATLTLHLYFTDYKVEWSENTWSQMLWRVCIPSLVNNKLEEVIIHEVKCHPDFAFPLLWIIRKWVSSKDQHTRPAPTSHQSRLLLDRCQTDQSWGPSLHNPHQAELCGSSWACANPKASQSSPQQPWQDSNRSHWRQWSWWHRCVLRKRCLCECLFGFRFKT